MSKMRHAKAVSMQVTNSKEVQAYFDGLTERLQRKVIRQAIAAGGTRLVKEVRKVLKAEQSREPRRRPQNKPLSRTIAKKAWSKPRKGLIGTVVGPKYPEGAHGHLVERGHRIVTKAGDTGRRTRALGFQELAEQIVEPEIRQAQRAKLAAAIQKERNKIRGKS